MGPNRSSIVRPRSEIVDASTLGASGSHFRLHVLVKDAPPLTVAEPTGNGVVELHVLRRLLVRHGGARAAALLILSHAAGAA